MKSIPLREFNPHPNWIPANVLGPQCSVEIWLSADRTEIMAFQFGSFVAVEEIKPCKIDRLTTLVSQLQGDVRDLSNRIQLAEAKEENVTQDLETLIASYTPEQVQKAMVAIVKNSVLQMVQRGDVDGEFAEGLFEDFADIEGTDQWYSIVESSVKANHRHLVTENSIRDSDGIFIAVKDLEGGDIEALVIESAAMQPEVDETRELEDGEIIIGTDEYRTARGWQFALGSNLVGKPYNGRGGLFVRRKTFFGDKNSTLPKTQFRVTHNPEYLPLEDGELMREGDQIRIREKWLTFSEGNRNIGNHFRKSEGVDVRRKVTREVAIR